MHIGNGNLKKLQSADLPIPASPSMRTAFVDFLQSLPFSIWTNWRRRASLTFRYFFSSSRARDKSLRRKSKVLRVSSRATRWSSFRPVSSSSEWRLWDGLIIPQGGSEQGMQGRMHWRVMEDREIERRLIEIAMHRIQLKFVRRDTQIDNKETIEELLKLILLLDCKTQYVTYR